MAAKDNIPTDPARILLEESRLARKQMSRAQRRLDTKLLCNQCGLAKTLFNKRYQDNHNCPVCDVPYEDRDNFYTSPDEGANKVFGKGIKELEQIMEEKETAPELQQAIIGGMNGVRSGTRPHPYTFGRANFGRGLSLQSILSDQADISWIKLFLGRWSIKWKEAQKHHYRNMNKKKSARSWAVAIIKKLMMIRWDLWQYRNTILHSPTGPIAIASHYSLNHRISEEKAKGTDRISKYNSCLFSNFYSITKLQSSDIQSKILWLEMVRLARADYEEPDSAIICQAISQRNQMQEFLLTNGPLVPVPVRARLIAVQDNQISEEDQQAPIAHYFGTPLITAINILGPAISAVLVAVTAVPPLNYIQQTLLYTL